MARQYYGLANSDRLHDLFNYFIHTARAAFGTSPVSLEAHGVYDPKSARLSFDSILTALAQLAALKVDTERCFISLIDDQHQIVIAEATASISLTDASHDPHCGGLSTGATLLDLESGVCAGTMPAFVDDYVSAAYIDTPNIYADRALYVIRDLSKEEKYKERPYVAG